MRPSKTSPCPHGISPSVRSIPPAVPCDLAAPIGSRSWPTPRVYPKPFFRSSKAGHPRTTAKIVIYSHNLSDIILIILYVYIYIYNRYYKVESGTGNLWLRSIFSILLRMLVKTCYNLIQSLYIKAESQKGWSKGTCNSRSTRVGS